MAICSNCGKSYDEDEVEWDFGDILMEKYGYQGDVLNAATMHCDYSICAECNESSFDASSFEDEYGGPHDI